MTAIRIKIRRSFVCTCGRPRSHIPQAPGAPRRDDGRRRFVDSRHSPLGAIDRATSASDLCRRGNNGRDWLRPDVLGRPWLDQCRHPPIAVEACCPRSTWLHSRCRPSLFCCSERLPRRGDWASPQISAPPPLQSLACAPSASPSRSEGLCLESQSFRRAQQPFPVFDR
jgi:hypothetical protein